MDIIPGETPTVKSPSTARHIGGLAGSADLEIGGASDLEVGATPVAGLLLSQFLGGRQFQNCVPSGIIGTVRAGLCRGRDEARRGKGVLLPAVLSSSRRAFYVTLIQRHSRLLAGAVE